MPRPIWRLLTITALVLLLHGAVLEAVYRALAPGLAQPVAPPPPPVRSVLAVGRIEAVRAGSLATPAPTQAPDHSAPSGSRSSVQTSLANVPVSAPQAGLQQVPVAAQVAPALAPLSIAQSVPAPVPAPPTLATADARTAGPPGAGMDPAAVPGQTGPKRATADPAAAPGLGAAGVASAADAPLRLAELIEPLDGYYPPISRARGEWGTVVVHVLIGADGRAVQAKVGTSSGYPRLDQEALAKVRKARFRPPLRGNTAQDGWYEHPVRFTFDR